MASAELALGAARQRRTNRLSAQGVIALVVLGLLILVAALADFLPLHPNAINLPLRLARPGRGFAEGGWEYILGADQLGRPLLARLIYGSRVSLAVAILVPLISAWIGVSFGLVSAEFKGRVDEAIMRFVDLWMSMPALLLALAVLYLMGPGFLKTVVVLGLLRWMVFARLTRARALAIDSLDYIEASRVAGCSRLRIMFRHVLPNCRGELLILAGLESSRAILAESGLSFLGFGIQAPDSSWGTILGAGRSYMSVSPGIILFPGLAILTATLSMNLLVDAWHDRDTLIDYE